MATELWAFGLALVASILAAFGPFYLKRGAMQLRSLKDLFPMPPWQLALGVLFHGAAAVLFVFALRGGEVSVLYPVVSFQYAIAAWLGARYLGEKVNWLRWRGIIVILVGIVILGFGSVSV